MTIPKNIEWKHGLKAAAEIDIKRFNKQRVSTKFDVIINNAPYPPKYATSLANKYANGVELRKAF